jgi:hypothetical protein
LIGAGKHSGARSVEQSPIAGVAMNDSAQLWPGDAHLAGSAR